MLPSGTRGSVAVEGSTGADRNGFNPFPGSLNCPSTIPGDISTWKPLWSDVEIAYNYASQVYLGTRDKTLMTLLGKYGIGDRV